jgi:hypothetical protein
MRRTMCFALALAAALGGSGAGCGPAPPSNLSPSADQDTDRHEQANRYTQDRARKNQQAERKVMGRISGSHSRK